MSTLSDLQKKLQQESEGIMFPFRASVPSTTVKTTQPVLDTATDGIMSVTGEKYIGPDSVIQYSPEGQRQLKEIEKGMLPQFDQAQFPDIGKGKVEDRGGTAPAIMDTTPAPEPDSTPAIDPCPDGFRYDTEKKVCVPIERDTGEKAKFTNRPRNIGDTAQVIGQVSNAIKDLQKEGGLYKDGYQATSNILIDNSTFIKNFGPFGKILDTFFFKNPADKKLEDFGKANVNKGITVSRVKNDKGEDVMQLTVTEEGKRNFDEIQTGESLKGNLASTQKTDKQGNIIIAPNGQPMIVGPISVGVFGTTSKQFTKASQKAAAARQKTIAQRAKIEPKSAMPIGGAFAGKGGGAPGYN